MATPEDETNANDLPRLPFLSPGDWRAINCVFKECAGLSPSAMLALVSVLLLRLIRAGGCDAARLTFGEVTTVVTGEGMQFYKVRAPGDAELLTPPGATG